MHHSPGTRRGQRLLMACLPGEQHELGLLLFALSAMARGYRVLYLGPDLPLSQVQSVAEVVSPAGVMLSGSGPVVPGELERDLIELGRSLDVPLMIGGAVSEPERAEWAAPVINPLGSRYDAALERLGELVPLYARR